MRTFAYYDFYSEDIRPLQLIVRAEPHELDWSAVLYIPVFGPFHRFEAEDFGDLTNITVLLGDLTRIPGDQLRIGINLPQIANRHGTEVEQLILQMGDVEEVMRFEV